MPLRPIAGEAVREEIGEGLRARFANALEEEEAEEVGLRAFPLEVVDQLSRELLSIWAVECAVQRWSERALEGGDRGDRGAWGFPAVPG